MFRQFVGPLVYFFGVFGLLYIIYEFTAPAPANSDPIENVQDGFWFIGFLILYNVNDQIFVMDHRFT